MALIGKIREKSTLLLIVIGVGMLLLLHLTNRLLPYLAVENKILQSVCFLTSRSTLISGILKRAG